MVFVVEWTFGSLRALNLELCAGKTFLPLLFR